MNVLTVGIGNTNVTSGLFREDKLEKMQIIPAASHSDETFIRKRMDEFREAQAAVMAGVNPPVQEAFMKLLGGIFGKPPYVCREDFDIPIKCNCKDPSKVGDDRLLNGLAAYDICKKACAVIDLGTALTIDYISAKGEFEGGVIFPGIMMSARALKRETAKLPEITAIKPGAIVGRDTEEAIQSGLFWGYRALIQGIIADMRIGTRGGPRIFATGGDAPYIMKDMDLRFKLVPHLTLLGLRLALKIQKNI